MLLLVEDAAASNFEVGASNVSLYAFYVSGIVFSWPRFNYNSWICSILTVVEIVLLVALRPVTRDISLTVVDMVKVLAFYAFVVYAVRQSGRSSRETRGDAREK